MARRRNVALIIETSNAYARSLLHGIRDYIRGEPGWSIYLVEHGRHELDHSFPASWNGDGVIARIETRSIARLIRSMDIPAVDVSAARLIPDIPWVETDDAAITAMALDHLASCGLRNFAFLGDPLYNWSRWRCQSYLRIAREQGFAPHVYDLPQRSDPQLEWYKEREKIHAWVRDLPKPVGVFACYDACALQLLEVCRYHEIPVPDEVAVVGVDNDELLCDLSYPTLTSVNPNARQTGHVAATLLARMMDGKKVAANKIAMAPLGIAKRMSTDLVAVLDTHVSNAVTYIREHACENIRVQDILAEVAVSRRVLESRFRRTLNRSPHREIVRVKIEHVKRLLLETDQRLASIAEATGFPHPEYLSVVFKRETGMTPREYRDQASPLRQGKPGGAGPAGVGAPGGNGRRPGRAARPGGAGGRRASRRRRVGGP